MRRAGSSPIPLQQPCARLGSRCQHHHQELCRFLGTRQIENLAPHRCQLLAQEQRAVRLLLQRLLPAMKLSSSSRSEAGAATAQGYSSKQQPPRAFITSSAGLQGIHQVPALCLSFPTDREGGGMPPSFLVRPQGSSPGLCLETGAGAGQSRAVAQFWQAAVASPSPPAQGQRGMRGGGSSPPLLCVGEGSAASLRGAKSRSNSCMFSSMSHPTQRSASPQQHSFSLI